MKMKCTESMHINIQMMLSEWKKSLVVSTLTAHTNIQVEKKWAVIVVHIQESNTHVTIRGYCNTNSTDLSANTIWW